MQAYAAISSDPEVAGNDLGPLAWVLDELRKSLDGATKAIRRFVRDAELARGSELESLDASQLRIARQQLHQAVGALEMVGLGAPAKVLRAMEALAQKFVQRPEFCSEEAATKVERASFALMEYLEAVLRGKSVSAVALFPQYRDVLQLVGEDRIHPADLWAHEWRWIDMALPAQSEPLAYAPAVRTQMDPAVLSMVKTGSVSSARILRDISLGLAAGEQVLEPRVFWKVCAAYFEALAQKLCPADVYVKRAASRVLLQYASLARGDHTVSDRLAQDLLFFCAQSVPASDADAPVLVAVRRACGLAQERPVDYETVLFGRFDPALLIQVRKRIATATDTWSTLSGGDTNRLKVVTDQFNLVCDSILKLHPESGELARALTRAVESVVRSGEPPATSLAMEVATAILYLNAAYEDMDPTDTSMAERGRRLALRLEHVMAGGQPEPLESWMEDLYRRVSDRQTMGGVVDELRTTLAEVENSLDQFFRKPQDRQPLAEVPSRLGQMRGVFSVLGLDQAALATLRLRDSVERLLVDEVDEATARTGVFEKLGNSLGALGFLIDMLSYQRALAKKLFVYDEALGEFVSLMGREKEAAPAPSREAARMPAQEAAPLAAEIPEAAERLQEVAALVSEPLAPVSEPPAQTLAGEDDDADLREIFLDEAREVVLNGQEALAALAGDPKDLGQQTTVRRVFHTLKGSSRMVGLDEFGEAAWAMEQLLNSWLAEQKPASGALLQLSGEAMQGFARWVEDIAQGRDAAWSAASFRQAADTLRLDGRLVPLGIPGAVTPPAWQAPLSAETELEMPAPPAEPLPELELAPEFELEIPPALDADQSARAVEAVIEPPLELDGIDFGSLAAVSLPTPSDVVAPALESGAMDFDEAVTRPGTLESVPAWGAGANGEGVPAELSLDEATQDKTSGLAEIRLPELELPPQAPGEPATEMPVSPVADAGDDEQVKVIGSLRIGIPLYNVYLNEADEWSRRLQTELSEWALELHRPVSDSTVALAHSLAGSSATVGFRALSEIARALELALQHVRLQSQGQTEQADIFLAAADNIRHLLHQFAAGFLKEPDPQLLDALHSILTTDFASTGAGVLTALPPIALDVPGDSVVEAREAAAETVEAEEDFSLDFVSTSQETAPQPEAAPAPVPAAVPPHAGAAQIVVEDHVDDIDAVDTIDPDLFPIFEEEAAELLPQLSGSLREWSARPENSDARMEVLRVLHTLKGSARLAGAMRLGEMAHRMESAIEQMGADFVQASQIDPLLTRFDALQQDFDALCADSARAQAAPTEVAEMPQAAPAAAVPAAPRTNVASLAQMQPVTVPLMPAVRHGTGQSVRVRSQLLDRLLNQAGEVMITRSRLDVRVGQLRSSLEELTGNLDRLRQHLRDIELQAESQMQSRLAQAKDTAQGFDPLEFDRFTRVQELTRMMAESVNDVATVQRNLLRTVESTEDDSIAQARQARELQRDLLRTRMVEFESISERLYGVVRQAAKDAGRQVKLDITGGSLEMDRGVLERMAPAFEHMLRNAVAHGIEAPVRREALGKSPVGTITIELHQEGNDVSITFLDDGAGLNLARIRERAQAHGLVPSGEMLSDADAANLIFTPGFSTATQVTELAGRGIGMDVVRSEVYALGGRIETGTEAGQGTRFKLVLPLTTAVTQVVMLRVGHLSVGVPASLVEIVRRASGPELAQAYQNGSFEYAGETVPFFWAGALLQSSGRSHEVHGKTLPVVMCRSAGQRLAVHVDEILGNQEVVVKNLGPQLSRLPGLAGMSVLASGAVVLIYNPVALGAIYGERARELQLAAQTSEVALSQTGAGETALAGRLAASELPLVLVVDDSITVRRVTQRLLKREGYRVALATDGLQALERLQEEKPAVVLTDIEMPRMDGFDLVRTIRMDARLLDLPIIMITSRIAQKHREHARELGVNHYLGKPYSEDELLDLVHQYSAATASV